MPRESVFRLGESSLDLAPLEQERIFSYQIRIYDRNGDKVGEFASGIKNVRMENFNFGYLRDGGCSDFSFTLGDVSPFTISYHYRVEFCFYDQSNPWYSGYVTKLPERGTAKEQIYSGYGYRKQLDGIRVNEIDTAQEVATIIGDTLDTYIVPNTDIVKDTDKIPAAVYAMISTMYWNRIPASDLFERLRQLAGSYEWGVDEERDFYFRAISTQIFENFWIGKHLDTFKGTEDPEAIRNRLYVNCGRLTDGSDYVFYVEDAASQVSYGLKEEVVVASEFWPTIDATDLASGVVPTTNPVAGVPANATDGNPATYWDSGAAQAIGHYIQVDLGAIFDRITQVILDSTDDAAMEQFARGFDIRISTTGAFAGEETVVFTSTAVSTNNPDIRFTPTQGRYVRITLTVADAEHWHLGEFEVHELDTSDIDRWANYILSQKKDIRKKASLTIKHVDELIGRKHVIVPFKPRGQWGIYDEAGNHIEDYPIISIKYSLSGNSFDMSAELGELERETISAEFKKQLQRLEEYKMSGVRSSDDLASGIGSSPLGITRTMIGPGVIEVPHLKANKLSMHGGLVEAGEGVLSGGGHGFVVKDGGAVYRVEMGRLNGDYGITIRDSAGVVWNLQGTSQNVWQEVYDSVLGANATSVTVAGLTGDTDHLYYIIARIIGNAALAEFHLRPNNDGGNNYYRQWISANDGVRASAEVNATTWMWMGSAVTNEICMFRAVLFATSGEIRTLLHDSLNNQTNVEPGPWYSVSQLWTNTVNEITSLVLISNQVNGIGAGSHISIYRIPSF